MFFISPSVLVNDPIKLQLPAGSSTASWASRVSSVVADIIVSNRTSSSLMLRILIIFYWPAARSPVGRISRNGVQDLRNFSLNRARNSGCKRVRENGSIYFAWACPKPFLMRRHVTLLWDNFILYSTHHVKLWYFGFPIFGFRIREVCVCVCFADILSMVVDFSRDKRLYFRCLL